LTNRPDELLLRTGEITKLDQPQARNRAGVATLIWNDRELCVPDRDYIHHVDDLIALGGDKERSWVHGMIEEFVTKLTPAFSRVRSRQSNRWCTNEMSAIVPGPDFDDEDFEEA
jgi:hypothetical protein